MTNQNKDPDMSEEDIKIQSMIKDLHDRGLCTTHKDENGNYHLHPEAEIYKIITQLHKYIELLDHKRADIFFTELPKNTEKILQMNDSLTKNNSILNVVICNLNMLDEKLIDYHRQLSSWISQAGGRLEFAAFDGVEKITRKFKHHMNINTVCNIVIIVFLYLIYKKIGAH